MFDPGKIFQAILIFPSKAKIYPSEAPQSPTLNGFTLGLMSK